MTTASLPQHQGLFLEPSFTVDLTAMDDDEDFDTAYDAPPAPTTSAREPERTKQRARRR
ncbi:hypothetical protein I3215_19910 [Streptomyces sp. RB110-1]|uniref:hypothetical protein n=1 Tax=unclassified Streptomyces TaxID=2593676 RepID=UPI0019018678|nr:MULTISPECIES: hypothetical protein [unclassified Streptomyces]MBK0375134.1 hypothetical protein [Streptomyces sp. RB110-1]MBK0388496.1 hypothetical protein [Streptomyces sp. RB110-2]